jgi:antitoxin (DNA-binding transcriptional repressor) of toxin-antitoxin stability system
VQSVNLAALKELWSAYITCAKAGEVVVIRDRNRPVAKLIPFIADDASEEELGLVAKGVMRLAETQMDWDAFDQMPMARVRGGSLRHALLDERDESR